MKMEMGVYGAESPRFGREEDISAISPYQSLLPERFPNISPVAARLESQRERFRRGKEGGG